MKKNNSYIFFLMGGRMERGTSHAKMKMSKNTAIESIWHWPEETWD